MIIRSQDKKILTDNLNLEIVTHDLVSTKLASFGEKNGEQSKIYNSVGLCMGIYSTEEKAIKVLDMIEKEYGRHIYGEGGQLSTTNHYVEPFAFIPPKVFQMPSDEEVEV